MLIFYRVKNDLISISFKMVQFATLSLNDFFQFFITVDQFLIVQKLKVDFNMFLLASYLVN